MTLRDPSVDDSALPRHKRLSESTGHGPLDPVFPVWAMSDTEVRVDVKQA